MIKNVLNSSEVAALLDVSQPTASRYIKRMNDEMEAEGYFSIRGKVPVQLFKDKFPYHDVSDEALQNLLGKER
ncbi:helix-turn-helix domain-containing protein [Staphylococcus kloosii]|jgi:CTP-dependent riboflavin kinase|uniref:helix-turn-helix domain-containing protein n=1 Tax=Staphylococcus kloosii TaxID=29384 RepID=UPI0018A11D9B|nr:LysR family transcriptional regulator [Staphylococcus kloosii]MBF7023709.1 LysR family transcriptional regulator [Staphylococcus kloosii]